MKFILVESIDNKYDIAHDLIREYGLKEIENTLDNNNVKYEKDFSTYDEEDTIIDAIVGNIEIFDDMIKSDDNSDTYTPGSSDGLEQSITSGKDFI